MLGGSKHNWQSHEALHFCLLTGQATAQAAGIWVSNFGFLVFLLFQLDGMSSREICSSFTLSLLVTSKSAGHALFKVQKYVYQHQQSKFRVVGIWLQKGVTEPLPSSWIISARQTLLTQNYSHGVGPDSLMSQKAQCFSPLPKWKASKQTFFCSLY